MSWQEKLSDIQMQLRSLRQETGIKEKSIDGEIARVQGDIKKIEKSVMKQLSPWEHVCIARKQERPTSLFYIENIFDDWLELHGDRMYSDDSAIIGGIARLGDTAVTVIGQQKGMTTKENIERNFGMTHPEGYRKALRLMKQAEKFKRPVICLIDTPGAYCGIGAEQRGQGEAIARNLFEISNLKTPIIAGIIGEGGSGGSLAIGIGDRVFMQQYAIYSILSPEGFASIVWKDSKKAQEAAKIMKITSRDLYEYGIIDKIIQEPIGGAHKDPYEAAKNIKTYLEHTLQQLKERPIENLVERRYEKIRQFGEYSEK